ncbi:MAG: hypothetical protein CMJ40_08185 [Phycisphaerae bacterium]|nr:hypothetical protein [Phycisphaerae bacterium]|tara:strand:+ start:12533 stop:13252 length:720 start_codon:yes stop_codon:yes gene_type:complete
MSEGIKETKAWYETSYGKLGVNAQRRYPNEELVRFMARTYFSVPRNERSDINILEIGCGSCANLWVIAKEGFKAHGLDLCDEAIRLGPSIMDDWGVQAASLKSGSMTDIPHPDQSMDCVVDIYSANCLNEADFETCVREVKRVLKPGGYFFSYTPGQESDAFRDHAPAKLIDSSTLNGIYRESSMFAGNHYPFRFSHPDSVRELMEREGFKVTSIERVLRSYNGMEEHFEHLTIDSVKM